MRLVCPNCEAKYEVPDDAIPDTGRDVQCTNCGHSWFQMRGRTGASPFVAPVHGDKALAAGAPAEPTASPKIADPVAETAARQPDAAEVETQAEVVPEIADQAVADTTQAAPAPLHAFPVAEPEIIPVSDDTVSDSPADEAEPHLSQDLEPFVGSASGADAAPVVDTEPEGAADPVLEPGTLTELSAQAEAMMPANAAAESGAVALDAVTDLADEAEREDVAPLSAASVPDYAVDDSVLAILREEAEREANARRVEALESQTELGIDAAIPFKGAALADADTKPAARRDLLPDVEEINSTLRPSEMQDDADGPDFVAPPPEAPRGFRSGFLSLMTIAILAAALYLVAPRLAVLVPALEGPLEGYVSFVDNLRLGLDGMMRSATVAISDG